MGSDSREKTKHPGKFGKKNPFGIKKARMNKKRTTHSRFKNPML